MAICPHCGTSTGTHWPECPEHGDQTNTTLRRRTEGERRAYVQGYEACLRAVEQHGAEFAKLSIQTTKEAL